MSYFDASTLLAVVPGVDLKTTGQTSLFVVPDANNLFITHVVIVLTAAATVTITPFVSVGKTAAFTEWIGSTQLVGLDTEREWVDLATATTLSIHQTFSSGEEVKFDVRTGATATAMVASVFLFGYIV